MKLAVLALPAAPHDDVGQQTRFDVITQGPLTDPEVLGRLLHTQQALLEEWGHSRPPVW